jgi:hypothetical protein
MMSHGNSILARLSICGLLAAGLLLHSAPAALAASDVVTKYDKDSDKTLDLAEVKAAASAQFDKLNKDSDDTLDAKEVKGVIGKKEFKAADPDNDGSHHFAPDTAIDRDKSRCSKSVTSSIFC